MTLRNVTNGISSWMKSQIGSDTQDFGKAADPGDSRREADRIDKSLERISRDAEEISQRIARVDEDSHLKPPTFRDVSDKQVLIGATSAGAAIGGSLGVLNGLAAGSPTVNITETTHDIMRPKLDGLGYDVQVFNVREDGVNIDGWDVDIKNRPLSQEKVGEYTTREAQVTGGGSVLVEGAKGLVIGGLGGAVIGAATVGLRRVTGQSYQGTPERETEGDVKLMAVHGGVGAAAGAGLGFLSALGQHQTVEYKTETLPAFVNQVIGQVPKGPGFFVPNSGGLQPPETPQAVDQLRNGNLDRLASQGYRGTDNLRGVDVRADGPVMEDRLIGSDRPVVNEVERTQEVGPNMVGSVIGGAVVGGIVGVAVGAVVNVLRKTL